MINSAGAWWWLNVHDDKCSDDAETFGSWKGAQKTSKNEFRFFLKSDYSALELPEILISWPSYSDFVLVT